MANRDRGHNMPGFGAAILSTSAESMQPFGFVSRINDPAYWMIKGSEQIQIELFRRQGRSANLINGISLQNELLKKFLEYGSKFKP